MVTPPFDTALLDRLLDDAGIDLLLATSKHNIQYLLGGYRSLFFDVMDASGLSRYLPILVYPKGKPDKAAFFTHRLDAHQLEVKPSWTPTTDSKASGSVDAMRNALAYLDRAGLPKRHIGVETAFLPADALMTLQTALSGSQIKNALFALERLRARKTPQELAMLRKASEWFCCKLSGVGGIADPGWERRPMRRGW